MTTPQQLLIYQSEDGSTRIDVMLDAETLWLSQKQLTELFGKAKGTISEHIKHIFEDGEQDENSVVRFFRTTAADGTFTDSLAKLTGDEQKLVKTTAFDLQMNPVNPGMSFHKLDKARDKNFWSVRVGSDIRLIVHKTAASLLLCYVDHHDKAYRWAERRKLETHPKTGAAQWVEIRERVEAAAFGRPLMVAEPAVRPWISNAVKSPLFAPRVEADRKLSKNLG